MAKKLLLLGSSGGIGKAVAQEFSDHHEYLMVESSRNLLEKNKNSEFLELPDVSQISKFDEFLKHIPDFDIVINCLGVTTDSFLGRNSLDNIIRTVNVNLVSNILLCNRFLPGMISRRFGKIVLIGSIVGEYGNIGQSTYASTKSALRGLVKTACKEIAHFSSKSTDYFDVSVNLVEPGFVKTRMTESVPSLILERILSRKPNNDLILPANIAKVVKSVVGSTGTYNGSVIQVFDGLSL